MAIATKIKRLRRVQGLTQAEVARKTKLTQSLIAQLETGAVLNPKVITLKRLAKALNTNHRGIIGMMSEKERSKKMDMMVSKQSKIEQAIARIPTRRPVAAQQDPDFDVQHLTAKDISKIEEALNTMDLEEMVATVDAIFGRHQAGRRSR